MSKPYLTDEEIAEMTDPLTQGAARCKYMEREYGVKVKKRPNGQPLVARAEFDRAMTQDGRRDKGARPPRPDWSKLKGMKQRPRAVVT